jgi:hypothetical protein
MPDLLARQQLFQITIGQVAYGITAIGAHGWGLIAENNCGSEVLKYER